MKKIARRIGIAAAVLIVLPIVLLAALLFALTIPSVQQKAVTEAARILSDKTGIEVAVGHFSVRPPCNILLGDVFVGGTKNDTLAFIGRMDARLEIKELPDSIAVNFLDLRDVVAHTGDLIPAVEIDGRIGRLAAGVKKINPQNFFFPITDGVLEDTDVSVKLLEGEETEDAPADTSSMAIVIDLQELSLKNVGFSLEPMGLRLDIGKAGTSTLVDLGSMCFTVHDIDVANSTFTMGELSVPVERLAGDAIADIGNNLITSGHLFASVPQMDVQATLTNTRFDLGKMQVSTSAKGSYAGTDISLIAEYDIDKEIYKADVNLSRTDIAKILEMSGDEIVVAGHIKASGKGINPSDAGMAADLELQLDSCRYNNIDVSGIQLAANLAKGSVSGTVASPVHYCDTSVTAALHQESHFSINDFLGELPGIALESRITGLDAKTGGDTLKLSTLKIDFKTDKDICRANINTPGIDIAAGIAAHALKIPELLPSFENGITLNMLESLIATIPTAVAGITIEQDNPLRGMLQKRGLDLNSLSASLAKAGSTGNLKVELKTPELKGETEIPAINAKLDADLRCDGEGLKMDGKLKLADLVYDGKKLGDRAIVLNVSPDAENPGHLVANATLDDIPVEIAQEFVELPEDISIHGDIRARATISGLPENVNIFAAVKPVGVGAEYKPYNVPISLGEEEITLEDNKVKLNGLRIIAADSTYVALDGGLDLGTMMLDVELKSDRFEPVKLPKDGPIPVYGQLLANIDGRITGPVDSLLAKVDIGILPQTDITYPIDAKNLAQVNPVGTVKVGFNPQTGLDLGGQIDVPKGRIFFSPKFYPMMPFIVDKGSCIKFNGGIDSTFVAISASQGAKSTYKPAGEVSRKVDFITGVKVEGTLDKIDIGFFLDAPKDAEIRKELAEMEEESREGLAAVLLATGMYASESNEAAQMEGYALSSIVQSKLNAAVSNKLGNKINLDFGVAKGKHGMGTETTDYTLNLSKSFFNNRLNVMLGGSVSDNVEVNRNSASFINNLAAEYKLDTLGRLRARIFSMKDYNNIIDGELMKSGAGVLYERTFSSGLDSLDRDLNLKAEGNIVYRSNNQLGPDAAVSLAKDNLFKRGDIFTTKIRGAYYWNMDKRMKEDPVRNDTYLLGADLSLSFPYLQLGKGSLKYIGQTLYRLGYLNENISGTYSMHKLYGGLDYSLRQNKYITHSFSPAYLSVVLADNMPDKLPAHLTFNDLMKLFASNEFIPSTSYSFSYNNYRNKNLRVNTALDIKVKESANLISGIMAACGQDFNKKGKTILGVDYDQFVKIHFELRNKFTLADRIELATRALAGAVITYGNSVVSPASEGYSIGGPNSIRAFPPRSLGPGNFNNQNYSAQVFHTGDIKLEMNAELRFPIFWKINGAVFVDAGNVWTQRSLRDYIPAEDIEAIMKAFNLTRLYDSQIEASTFLNQIALGTGAGLRLDYESIVIRLDLGIAIHAPFDTGRRGYYNIPNLWRDGMCLNFGIGYPF
ncbi:MAG: translocation/assembly module TamB domain-containing protein [Bacteroidales bacterium]|nr:translocation/assembly module TamB domain-containing protein [Bacteroidales bacterium]